MTGDSALTSLSDAGGISGTSITTIISNSHMVSCDKSLAANSVLEGRTLSAGERRYPGAGVRETGILKKNSLFFIWTPLRKADALDD